MQYILALDQGTTSSRAIVFDEHGQIRAVAQKELEQHYPRPGWVEHDPLEIWSTQVGVAAEALTRAGLQADDLAAVGIANQRETTVLWDRETLQPIANAVVWQDRRTAGAIDALKARGLGEEVRAATGLLLDPYFSASKIAWLLDNVDGARERAEAGELAFGTVDSWLTARLTRGRVHATDVSNASRTLLFDIAEQRWSERLAEVFGVPPAVLPEIVSTSGVVEVIESGPLAGVPLAALAGDQQAATFGQACFTRGDAKNTYGTGCFLVLNTGTEAVTSSHDLLTTVAWRRDEPVSGPRRPVAAGAATLPTEFALEGSVFTAGAVVQWLRDGLGIIRSAEDVEALARSVPDSGGVMLVPALTGLGAPHWDPYARGTVLGLSRGSTAGHLARAALDGIAFQVADVLDALEDDSGLALDELRVDGGASRNDTLMQIQADLIGIPVVRPEITETTALGAAYLAGLAVGFWSGQDEIESLWREDRRFEPRMGDAERAALRERWSEAVARAKGWEPA